MSEKKRPVSILILDQKITVTTDADPKQVESLAAQVSKDIEQVLSKTKNSSPFQAAVLVALNLASQLDEQKLKHNDLQEQVSKKSQNILNLLDSVIS